MRLVWQDCQCVRLIHTQCHTPHAHTSGCTAHAAHAARTVKGARSKRARVGLNPGREVVAHHRVYVHTVPTCIHALQPARLPYHRHHLARRQRSRPARRTTPHCRHQPPPTPLAPARSLASGSGASRHHHGRAGCARALPPPCSASHTFAACCTHHASCIMRGTRQAARTPGRTPTWRWSGSAPPPSPPRRCSACP